MISDLEKIFNKILPSPFSIAVILTGFIIVLCYYLTDHSFNEILTFWESGLWNISLMNFAMQMMLMLVLGYVLALSETVDKVICKITPYCNNTLKAAYFVSLTTIIVSFLNWGLGLIFGAILTRKVGEYNQNKNNKINYPLVGAAGYSGLMVWHGGFSGSIPLKIAEKNHFREIITDENILSKLPKEGINFSETVLSSMNITASLLIIILIPLTFLILAKYTKNTKRTNIKINTNNSKKDIIASGEKLDRSVVLSKITGLIILFVAIRKGYLSDNLSVINPNYINLLLLGVSIFLHKNFFNFVKSVNTAITSASGILIQFPLYFGIMGIMNSSGLVDIFANFFVSFSSEQTYPILTMISGGIVNIFVPSGGGQWAVQGLIVIQSALEMGVPVSKSIMALVYGDQLTNMLQPFWALPLLGITQIKAKHLLPYTLIIMLVGIGIFSFCLIFI